MLYSRRRSLVALLSAAGAYGVSARRTVAFHYQAVFSPGAVRWYTRFSMLVTGGILSAKQTQILKGDGNKLIAYNWASAFYPDDDASAPAEWRKLVQQHAGAWLLNAVPMGGGAAAPDRTAFWYDFGDSDLIAARARFMADALANTGYDGYFFDTLGLGNLPARLQEEFRRRHPYLVYDERQGEFLRELRVYLGPRRVIFTNQGYRNPGAFLPNADLDLSESYFTFIRPQGGTGFRKWWSADAPWDSVKVPMDQLVAPASRKYPNVSFVHLNYAEGDQLILRRAIQYSFACAKLWNHDCYLIVPEPTSGEQDDIYFAELGRPASTTYQEDREAGVAWRVFEKGVVAINSGTREAVIPSLRLRLPDPPRGYVFLG